MKKPNRNTIPWNLIIDKLSDNISEVNNERLSLWLEQEENRNLFIEIEQLWENIQSTCQGYTPDEETCWKELSKRLGWEEATIHENTERPKHESTLYKYIAVAACMLLLIGLSFYAGIFYGDMNNHVRSQTYKNINGKSKVFLPDGTTVWLHAYSELTFDMKNEASNREVQLTGEAYFEVASNKDKPFIVHTGNLDVQVCGTKFNVEAFCDKEYIAVSLLEGSVMLNTFPENGFLFPEETGYYNKATNKLSVVKDDVAFASSWAQERLTLTDRPLGEIVRYLAKWYQKEIYVDPLLEDQYAYTFTIVDEPLEEIVRLMARIHPLAYSFDEEDKLYITHP